LRVAVAGAGAFGRNHLRVYRELEAAGQGVALAAAVEPDSARAADTAAKYAIPVYPSVAELLSVITLLLRPCSTRASTYWWKSRSRLLSRKPTI
jgi:hypothetical protein